MDSRQTGTIEMSKQSLEQSFLEKLLPFCHKVFFGPFPGSKEIGSSSCSSYTLVYTYACLLNCCSLFLYDNSTYVFYISREREILERICINICYLTNGLQTPTGNRFILYFFYFLKWQIALQYFIFKRTSED